MVHQKLFRFLGEPKIFSPTEALAVEPSHCFLDQNQTISGLKILGINIRQQKIYITLLLT